MAGVNKVILVGNLGKDPELREFANGGAVANTTLATSESWKDKDGNRQERTEWHNVVFHNKLAEVATEYLRKGSKVYVEGKLRTRKWEDKEGVTRYTTEISVENMQMLDGKPSGEREQRAPQSREPARSTQSRGHDGGGFGGGPDDDIPFRQLSWKEGL